MILKAEKRDLNKFQLKINQESDCNESYNFVKLEYNSRMSKVPKFEKKFCTQETRIFSDQ
jgi:hypothetical protein